MDRTEHFLKELTEAPGVPGYESPVRAVMRRYLEPVAARGLSSFSGRGSGSLTGAKKLALVFLLCYTCVHWRGGRGDQSW